MPKLDSLPNVLLTVFGLWLDALRFIGLSLRRHSALAAESRSDEYRLRTLHAFSKKLRRFHRIGERAILKEPQMARPL